MHALVALTIAFAALAHAKPYDDGIILKGPSGVITKNGPIGPTGPATGGAYEGGAYEGGAYGGGAYEGGAYGGGAYEGGDYNDDAAWPADGSYPGDAYSGAAYAGAAYAGPAAVVAAPYYAPAPAPYYAPAAAYAAPGVAIKGPQTVPVVVAGPTGKIQAGGLYSPPAYGPKKYYR